jgi:hypothetical protein
MAGIKQAAALLTASLGLSTPAFGCPFCQSGTAEKVRAGIFNSDFGYHLGVSLAPFPVLIAILILIFYGPARRPRRTAIEQLQSEKLFKPRSEQT